MRILGYIIGCILAVFLIGGILYLFGGICIAIIYDISCAIEDSINFFRGKKKDTPVIDVQEEEKDDYNVYDDINNFFR